MKLINAVMHAANDRVRRAPGEFRLVVVHPVDFVAIGMEISAAAETGKSWALSCRRTSSGAVVLPNGLEVHCSQGIVQGWAVFQDHRGVEGMTMVALPTDSGGIGDPR